MKLLNKASHTPEPMYAHTLSSAPTDGEIDLLMTDKTGNAEPIRRKLSKGKKQKKRK